MGIPFLLTRFDVLIVFRYRRREGGVVKTVIRESQVCFPIRTMMILVSDAYYTGGISDMPFGWRKTVVEHTIRCCYY